MTFFKYLLLAIVQGISEILPISSSGHLIIMEHLLGMEQSNGFLALAIFLHFGSLIAVIIYYRKEIWNIFKGTWLYLFSKKRNETDKQNAKLFLWIILATIPGGIVGVFANDYIDRIMSSLWFVFSFMIITGILLLISKNMQNKQTLQEMKWGDALLIGIFQSIGVLPGISRSGITIFGAKWRKFSNEEAAKFSFLLFIPITTGSFLFEVMKVSNGTLILQDSIYLYIIGILIAGIVTFFSLKFLFGMIIKGKLYYFSYYCFAIGIIGLVYLVITTFIA